MAPKPITTNTLFYGDNLPILREHIADLVGAFDREKAGEQMKFDI